MPRSIFSPLIQFFKHLFTAIYQLTGNLGLSLIGLSLVSSLIVLLLNRLLKKYEERDLQIRAILEPQEKAIRDRYYSHERHSKLQALYKRYSYHPLLALRSSFSLFLQIPFLLSAYYMITELPLLEGKTLLGIPDLSKPDGILWGANLLPLVMTGINLLAAYLTPKFNLKDRLQAALIAILFLVLLYRSPSALLFYWTMNNLIFLLRVLFKPSRNKFPDRGASPRGIKREKYDFTHIGEFMKHYSGLLVLFYFVQAMFVSPWYMFCGLFKYIPFALAAYIFWIIQVKDLLSSYRSDLKHNTALILVCLVGFMLILLGVNLIAPLVLIDCQIYTFFHYVAFLLGISGFAIGFLLHEPNKDADKNSSNRLAFIVILSGLIPALHFASVNPDYLSGIYYLVYILAIVLFSIISLGTFRLSCSFRSSQRQTSLTAGVFAFSMISLPLVRYLFKIRNDGDIDFWILACLLLFGSFWIRSDRSLKLMQRSLIITMSIFCISFIVSISHNSLKDFSQPKQLTTLMKKITLKDKPNIYLFVYDGIPNERVFKTQNLPFDRIRIIAAENGFKMYDDTYTLGEMSLDSMGNMLNMNNQLISKVGKNTTEAHDTYAGNSYTNLILRKNSYSSHFLLNNYYVSKNAITNKNYFDEMYPPRVMKTVDWDFFAILLRGIFQGEMNFDTKGWEVSDINQYSSVQKRKLELISDQHTPKFVVNHLNLPGHSQNSGVCLPDETERWKSNLSQALIYMKDDFEAVVAHDPEAIVIAIGDHGPSLTGDCYRLAGWPRSKISIDMIWDRIGTMVAIRWPDPQRASKYDEMLVTNQDIFPVVFAYLMDDPAPLKLCPTDEFYGFKTPGRAAIGFDKGRFIE